MTHLQILLTVVAYVVMLYVVAWHSGRKATGEFFYTGGRDFGWWIVALGMIGAPMSGVSFVSVPGSVAFDSFSYLQMVLGFTVGQIVIALWLVPLFYRSGVTSLYEWLDMRYGVVAHRSGAMIFFVAKLMLTALKLLVVVEVLQVLLFDILGLPFWLNVAVTVALVWGFTIKAGVRSVVWTDVLQSALLISSVVGTILFIYNDMEWSILSLFEQLKNSSEAQIFFDYEPQKSRSFWQMFIGGVFILVAMTGLDQDMMQRNLSCRSCRASQLNILLTALCQAVVIALLLVMGWMLYTFASFRGLAISMGDAMFGEVVMSGAMPTAVGVLFILALMSSTYSTAGSALTSLTTSTIYDLVSPQKRQHKALRSIVHTSIALLIALIVLLLHWLSNQSLINLVYQIVSYLYGPILGLFLFGELSNRLPRAKLLPIVVTVAPVACYILKMSALELWGYNIGYELILYNALICVTGLYIISKPKC